MPRQISKKNKIFFYFVVLILISTISNINLSKIYNNLFVIKSINIDGLNEQDKYQINSTLKFLVGSNLLFLNSEIIENEMKNFNYLEKYDIVKEYPDKINIYGHYTKLVAKTFIDGNTLYLASNRNFINQPSLNIPSNLPNIFGNFKPDNYFKFIELLIKNNLEINDIVDYYYYESNRWDIKTKNGITIRFPVQDLEKYIRIANSIIENDKGKKIIDLRVSNQVIITNE